MFYNFGTWDCYFNRRFAILVRSLLDVLIHLHPVPWNLVKVLQSRDRGLLFHLTFVNSYANSEGRLVPAPLRNFPENVKGSWLGC